MLLAMSTIYTVDWTQFLGPDSELPADVTFNVIQTSGTYKGGGNRIIMIDAKVCDLHQFVLTD